MRANGKKALSVCLAVSNKKTFEYIEIDELWYLIIVNMPFFQNKLEWGSSIRGAWWNLYGNKTFKLKSCGLFLDDEQVLELNLNESEWKKFIVSMIEFVGFDNL